MFKIVASTILCIFSRIDLVRRQASDGPKLDGDPVRSLPAALMTGVVSGVTQESKKNSMITMGANMPPTCAGSVVLANTT